jgi:hypothetical protein
LAKNIYSPVRRKPQVHKGSGVSRPAAGQAGKGYEYEDKYFLIHRCLLFKAAASPLLSNVKRLILFSAFPPRDLRAGEVILILPRSKRTDTDGRIFNHERNELTRTDSSFIGFVRGVREVCG